MDDFLVATLLRPPEDYQPRYLPLVSNPVPIRAPDYESGFLSDTIPDKAEVWAAVLPRADADAQAHAPSSGPGPSRLESAPGYKRASAQGRGPAVRQQVRLVRSRLLLYDGGDWKGQGGGSFRVSRCGLQLVALGGRGLGGGDGFGEGGVAPGGTAAAGSVDSGAVAGSRDGDKGGEMTLELELWGWAAWPGGVPGANREGEAEAAGAAGPSGSRGVPAVARQGRLQQPQQQRELVLGCSGGQLCGTSLHWLLLQRQHCKRLQDRCPARRQLLLADPGEDADAGLGPRRGHSSRVRWLWQAEESPGGSAQRQTDKEHKGVHMGAGTGDGVLVLAEEEVQGYVCVLCGKADDFLYPNLACLMAHLRACHGHEPVSCTIGAGAATHGSAGDAAQGAGMRSGGAHGSAGGKEREDAGKAAATHGSAAVKRKVAGGAAQGSASRRGGVDKAIAASHGQGLMATIRLTQRAGAKSSCKLRDGRAPAPGNWWSSNAAVDNDWIMYGGKVYDKLPSYDDYIEAAGGSDDAAGARAGSAGAAGEVGLDAAEVAADVAVAGFAAGAAAGGHAAYQPQRREVALLGPALGPDHGAPAGMAGGREEERSGVAKAAAAGTGAAAGLGAAAATEPTALAPAVPGGPAGAAGTGEPPRRGQGPSNAAAVGGIAAGDEGPAVGAAAAGGSRAGRSGQGPGGTGGPADRHSDRSNREGDAGGIINLADSESEEEAGAAPGRSGAGGGGDRPGGAVRRREGPANPRNARGPHKGAVGVSAARRGGTRGVPVGCVDLTCDDDDNEEGGRRLGGADGRKRAGAGGMPRGGSGNDQVDEQFEQDTKRAKELSWMEARWASMGDEVAAAAAASGGRGGAGGSRAAGAGLAPGLAAQRADGFTGPGVDDDGDDDEVVVIDSDDEGQGGGEGGGARHGLAGGGGGGAAGGGGVDEAGGAAAGAVVAPEPAAAGQAGYEAGAGGTAAAEAATAGRVQAGLQDVAAGTSEPADKGAGTGAAAYAAAYIPWHCVRLSLPEAMPLTAAGTARGAGGPAAGAGEEEQIGLDAAGAAGAAPEPSAAVASRAGRPPARAASGALAGGDDEAGTGEGDAPVLAAREALASAGGAAAAANPRANDGARGPRGWAGAYAGVPETPGGAPADDAAGSGPAPVPHLHRNGTGPRSDPATSHPGGSPAAQRAPRAPCRVRSRKNPAPCRLAEVLSLRDMERMLHEAHGPSAGAALGPGLAAGRAASAFFTELQAKVWEASAAMARRTAPNTGEPGGAEGQDEGHGADVAVGTCEERREEELWGGAGAGEVGEETAGKEVARRSVKRGPTEMRSLRDDALQMPHAKRQAASRADAAVAAAAPRAAEAGPSGSQQQQEDELPGLPPRLHRPHRSCVAAAQAALQKPPLVPQAKRVKMGHKAGPAGTGQGGGAWGPFKVPELLRNSWNTPPPGQCADFSAPRVFVHIRTYTPLTQVGLRGLEGLVVACGNEPRVCVSVVSHLRVVDLPTIRSSRASCSKMAGWEALPCCAFSNMKPSPAVPTATMSRRLFHTNALAASPCSPPYSQCGACTCPCRTSCGTRSACSRTEPFHHQATIPLPPP